MDERERFHVIDVRTPSVISVRATLRLASDHAYFYVQDDLPVDDASLHRAARGFEERVYPLLTTAFGPDPGPGYDGDPHLAILNADVPGVGGYFTDQDLLPPAISPFSNEREMVVLNVAGMEVGSEIYLGVLAHEFQHLIHHYVDPTEDSWVNEGLSEVANQLVSDSSGLAQAFLRDTDLQLTDWAPLDDSAAHYGSANLFMRYLLERTGGADNAHLLIEEPADGGEGIADYLEAAGSPLSFEELFRDWTIANYLDLSRGEYHNPGTDDVAHATARFDAPVSERGLVHQFGTDYLVYEGDGPVLSVGFQGDQAVPVIPAPPPDGSGFWFSGRGDGIDSRLTRSLDLRAVDSATLHFLTWYDIEEGWDYGYVEVSTDGGVTWEIVRAADSSDLNPLGLAYGPAFTGQSGGSEAASWVPQRVDLTPFAGKRVLVRWEYITDEATNLGGWAIDDLRVPEIRFGDTGDTTAGWEAEGFQRVAGPLRQQFAVQVILEGGAPSVEELPLDAMNRGSVIIEGLGEDVDRVILVVSGVTPGSNQPAGYRYSFNPQ